MPGVRARSVRRLRSWASRPSRSRTGHPGFGGPEETPSLGQQRRQDPAHVACLVEDARRTGGTESERLDSNQRPPASEAGALPTAPLPDRDSRGIEERVRGLEPLPPAWRAVVLAVEHHTRRVPHEAGSTPGWARTNDLPRIRRVLYLPSYGRIEDIRGPAAAARNAAPPWARRRSTEGWTRTSDSTDFTRELYASELPRPDGDGGTRTHNPQLAKLEPYPIRPRPRGFPRVESNHRPAAS